MYSYKTEDNKPHKRCKGIKKCVIEEITHTDYDNCLNNREQLTKKQKLFTSEKHKVYYWSWKDCPFIQWRQMLYYG